MHLWRFLLLLSPILISIVSAQDVLSALSSNSDLSRLSSLLQNLSSFSEFLNSARDITILAPTNDAVDSLLDSLTPEGEQEPPAELLEATLTYHTLNGRFPASEIASDGQFIQTLLTDPEYVNITGGQAVYAVSSNSSDDENAPPDVTFYSGYNTESSVVEADILISNGLVHTISSPLAIPPNVTEAALSADLTALVGAVSSASFAWNSWSNATFFAPTNAAFETVASSLSTLTPEELHTILMYHVINDTVPIYTARIDHANWISTTGTNVTFSLWDDGTIFVNSARIVTANVLVANGVVHVIDQLLNPNATANNSSGQLPAPTDTAQTSGTPAFPSETSLDTIPITGSVPVTSVTEDVPFTSDVPDAMSSLANGPSQTPSDGGLPPTEETAGATGGAEDSGAAAQTVGITAVAMILAGFMVLFW